MPNKALTFNENHVGLTNLLMAEHWDMNDRASVRWHGEQTETGRGSAEDH